MKFLTILAIIVLIGGIGYYAWDYFTEEDKPSIEYTSYQGPVPEGYDEEHFRETGETKEINEGRVIGFNN